MYKRWSTAEIEPHRRREFVSDAICESYLLMALDINPFAARTMNFMLERHGMDTLDVIRTRSDVAGSTIRTSAHVARQPEETLYFNVNLGSAYRIRHGGLETICDFHEAVLLSSTQPIDMTWNGSDVVSLAVPARVFGNGVDRARHLVSRSLQPSAPLEILKSQILALASWPDEVPAGQAGVIADGLVSMLRCALLDDAHERVDARTRRHLTRRIRALVAETYTDPLMTPLRAALDLGVPVRTLHDALAHDSETFMSLLMTHRLHCARSLLMSSLKPVRVADISMRCGFRSTSHFARRFRERYGKSPSAFASGS